MPANGPAIKGVCVAERMEAGSGNSNRGRVPLPAGMKEAWRTFCRPDTNFMNFTSVAVQLILGAGNKSRYTEPYCGRWRGRGIVHYNSVLGAGTNCKKCDKQMNFIVRVGCSYLSVHSKFIRNSFVYYL